MTFDITGLLVFLLAIVPGFLAQEARYSLSPRSLKPKSVLEEPGNYVLNSVLIHFLLIIFFRAYLSLFSPSTLSSFDLLTEEETRVEWVWENWGLIALYFATSLGSGFVFGLFRGLLALRQPIRNRLLNYRWFNWLIGRLGIYSFLEEEPVWYGVFRQRGLGESIFLEVTMKRKAGFYAGVLHSYGILDDSVKEKDFYLKNVSYKKSEEIGYRQLDVDGILLNFGDVEAIEVVKRNTTSNDKKFAQTSEMPRAD